MTEFAKSQEAKFRRIIRADIKRGPFTKGERDVVLAFMNHWFHHRKSKDGIVYPGRKKLATKAGVSVATVKRTFGMLRHYGVLTAFAHLEGLHGKATEYCVNTIALTELCAKKKADILYNGGSNDPTQGRVKMTHRLSDVVSLSDYKKSAGGAA